MRLQGIIGTGVVLLTAVTLLTGCQNILDSGNGSNGQNGDGSNGGDTDQPVTYTVGGSISTDEPSETNQTFTLNLNNGTETLTMAVTADNYEFSTEVSGEYEISFASQPNKQFCTISNQSGTAKSDVTADVSCTTTPRVVESTPSDGATGVSPASSEIEFVFNEALSTSGAGATPSIDMHLSSLDAGGEPIAETTGPEMDTNILAIGTNVHFGTTNETNDTLTITLSWVRFPENAPLTYELSLVDDADGNEMKTTRGAFLTGNADLGFDAASTFTGPTTANQVATNITNDEYATQFWSGEGTVYWTACPAGYSATSSSCDTKDASIAEKSWANHVNSCADLNDENFSGENRSNWRMPTREELATIYRNSGCNDSKGTVYYDNSFFGCGETTASDVYAAEWQNGDVFQLDPYSSSVSWKNQDASTGAVGTTLCISLP